MDKTLIAGADSVIYAAFEQQRKRERTADDPGIAGKGQPTCILV